MSSFPRLILLFLVVDWPIFMRRKMVCALAEAAHEFGATVVAVNRPLCPFSTIIRKPHRIRELLRKPALQKLSDNLYLFSPKYFIYDGIASKIGLFENLNLRALQSRYAWLTAQIGIDEHNPLIWFHHPQQGYLLRLFPKSFCIFELYDNLVRYDGIEMGAVNQLEKRLHTRTDLFLATSPKLLDKYGHNYKTAWLSGNGLDRETFQRLSDTNLEGHPELLEVPSPRIGYTGNISKRLDWMLIENLVRKKPEWSFIFVGKIYDKEIARRFRDCGNMHFMGPYDHAQIPSVLKAFDVGIMPYLDNDFFHYSNPLKFYEFAAAGIRSVSSRMEILHKFPADLVKIMPPAAEQWILAIEQFLETEKSKAGELGIQVASEYIWENMLKELLHGIQERFFAIRS